MLAYLASVSAYTRLRYEALHNLLHSSANMSLVGINSHSCLTFTQCEWISSEDTRWTQYVDVPSVVVHRPHRTHPIHEKSGVLAQFLEHDAQTTPHFMAFSCLVRVGQRLHFSLRQAFLTKLTPKCSLGFTQSRMFLVLRTVTVGATNPTNPKC